MRRTRAQWKRNLCINWRNGGGRHSPETLETTSIRLVCGNVAIDARMYFTRKDRTRRAIATEMKTKTEAVRASGYYETSYGPTYSMQSASDKFALRWRKITF